MKNPYLRDDLIRSWEAGRRAALSQQKHDFAAWRRGFYSLARGRGLEPTKLK